jgi:transketolase
MNSVEMIEPRTAFGKALVKIGSINRNFVVLSPDVGISTRAIEFKEKFPDRYFCFGIAEYTTFGVAAGFCDFGYTPIVPLYAGFAVGKAADQVINGIAYPNLNVKIIGTHGGINAGEDGPTHQSVVDIGFFRSIPNFVVLAPSDAQDVEDALELALNHKGPVYIRLERMACSSIPHAKITKRIGQGEIVRDGTDITVIAIGSLVQAAINAAEKIKSSGVSVRVINTFSIKPIDEKLIIEAAKDTKVIITAEDHNYFGGLFSAVSEVVAGNGLHIAVHHISVDDEFAESGSGIELRKKYHIDSDAIVSKIEELMVGE